MSAEYKQTLDDFAQDLDSPCFDMDLPDRVCTIPLQGRAEFTPRNDPYKTSIRSLISSECYIPQPLANEYDPPDVYMKSMDPPDWAFDYLHVVENGPDYVANSLARKEYAASRIQELREYEQNHAGRRLLPGRNNVQPNNQSRSLESMPPGQGWGIDTLSAADNCDGTYDSFCGRSGGCMLSGHNDNRGGLQFDALSGWLHLTLPRVEHGLIMIKMEDWLQPGENQRTADWICENNSCDSGSRYLAESDQSNGVALDTTGLVERTLKEEPPKCTGQIFQFAIDDGPITSWNNDQLLANKIDVQRVVAIWKLLDDENFATKDNVKVSIRLTGSCKRERTYQISHIYWA